MKRIEVQFLAMLVASLAALAAIVAFFFRPSDFEGVIVRSDTGRTDRVPAAAAPLFVDVTDQSGVAHSHAAGVALVDIRQVMAPGVGAADVDGDGHIDLFFPGSNVGPSIGNRLYRNLGGMRFAEIVDAGGARRGESAMGCAIADVENDGDLDIFVTALGPNRLYINDGGGRFDEVGDRVGLADARWSAAAAWGDYDGDGLLDLYVANYVRYSDEQVRENAGKPLDRDEPQSFSPYVFAYEVDGLYRNDEGGRFTDVTGETGIADPSGKGMGVLFADVTRDRKPDILVINDVSPNQFYHNVGGRFADTGAFSGLSDPRSGMGAAIGDYDNDGWFDVFSTHWQDESNVLYRNLGVDAPTEAPLFDDVSIPAGLAAASIGLTGWGACMADFDLDGDLDIVIVNGYTSPSAVDATQCVGQPALYFSNDNGVFVNRSDNAGLVALSTRASRGAAAADLDDDGDLDLVVTTNNGPAFVFENRTPKRHFLRIRPMGQAVGCVVSIVVNTRSQHRIIVAGSSYLSSEPLEAHFGLGDATRVDRVTVVWADGRTAETGGVAVDQILSIERPK